MYPSIPPPKFPRFNPPRSPRACFNACLTAASALTLAVAAPAVASVTSGVGISASPVPAIATSVTEINQQIAAALPGGEIVVRDGTYDSANINFTQHGSASQPITLRAQTRGKVIFTGASSLTISGEWLIVDGFIWRGARKQTLISFNRAKDCEFRHNALIDSGPEPTVAEGSIKLQNSSVRNSLIRNRFENLPAQGIRLTCNATNCGNVNNRIAYNLFYGKKSSAGSNNGESIQLGSGIIGDVKTVGDLSTVVESNLFENIEPSQEMISSKTNRNIFRFNTFRNTQDRLVLRMGTHAEVYGNWFINAMGIRVHESNHSLHDNHMEGVNGPAFMLPSGKMQDGCYHWPADSVRIVANTLVGTTASAIQIGGNKMESNGCTYSEVPKNGYYEENLIVNFTANAFSLYAPADQTYVENIAWPAEGSSTGVSFVDPLLVRNAMGAYISKRFPARGAVMQCRALTAADVGPSSTYACN
ncbi:chondroitinase-B domain-containing protein [Stigmatella erecta]|uniref:Chondroitinase B n=1 Tax=Stigmatella erecta TaxID=83460 RepID=A0A1I0KS77_9BACT|nr:chondroitinase-B domain-containing protein [Stigmatella erecta]SEU28426.1 Chondroitinase B [Stigmatella erecta]